MSGNRRRGETESQLKVLLMAITRNPQLAVTQLMLGAKLAKRWIRRLPFAGRFTLFLLLSTCVIYYIFSNPLTSDVFLEVDKCPACFGSTACSAARSGDVWFTGWSMIRPLHYVNAQNVYAGGYVCKQMSIVSLSDS